MTSLVNTTGDPIGLSTKHLRRRKKGVKKVKKGVMVFGPKLNKCVKRCKECVMEKA